MRYKNEIGNKYGKLTVLEFAGHYIYPHSRHALWECLCDCGRKSIVSGSQLRAGNTKTCGCSHHLQIGERNPFYGKTHSKETKYKMSILAMGKYMGEKSGMWKGGITPEKRRFYCSWNYSNWRKQIFERDNYTCQICGSNKGGTLQAHHILPRQTFPKLSLNISNGITVCKNCHKQLKGKEMLYAQTLMKKNIKSESI